MRKKNEPIHYNKSLAKIFAIANQPKRCLPSQQFPECGNILPMPTLKKRGCDIGMDSSSQRKGRMQRLRLQFEIIDVDSQLEHIARLYTDTIQTIDRVRDLLGRYSHMINGVDMARFCSISQQKHTTITAKREEVTT
jgi:hypothetical protein